MTVKSLEIELVLNLSHLVINNRDEQDETPKRSNKDRPPVPGVNALCTAVEVERNVVVNC